MTDKPIREQSALELLETHAKALADNNVDLAATADAFRDEISRLRAALEKYAAIPNYGAIARQALAGLPSETSTVHGADHPDDQGVEVAGKPGRSHAREERAPGAVKAVESDGSALSTHFDIFGAVYRHALEIVHLTETVPAACFPVETAALPTSEGTCTCPPHLDPLGCAAKTCPRAIAARVAVKTTGGQP